MTKPIDEMPMPPKGDGSTDHETLTHDIEVKLESAIRALIDQEVALTGAGRRTAALVVAERLHHLHTALAAAQPKRETP